LITHVPPFAICDGAFNQSPNQPEERKRQGCSELRDEILNRIKPMYSMFGHNHDGHGTMEIEGTKFINCAFLNDCYQPEYGFTNFELPFKKEAN
jgi:Icc-related predicted phosphoesterase